MATRKKGTRTTTTSEAATALGALGAAKGGRARAEVLAPSQRSEVARKAAQARWKNRLLKDDQGSTAVDSEASAPRPGKGDDDADAPPSDNTVPDTTTGPSDVPTYSMFPGTLTLGGLQLACHVLNDGRRVFAQQEMVAVLTGGTRHGNLARYLKANPLTVEMVSKLPIIPFRIPKGNVAYGYKATFLVDMCTAFVEAWEQDKLKDVQYSIVRRAEIMLRACAKVGIEALVDEATGYQKFRKKQELQVKLKAFIAEEMQEWVVMFPDQFWYELARLENVHYSPRSRPLRWGKYVMAFVYDAMDKDVGNRLRALNPDPHYKQNHHQWLAQYGKAELQKQLWQVIGIMQACKDMAEFRKKFAHVFKHVPLQLDLLD